MQLLNVLILLVLILAIRLEISEQFLKKISKMHSPKAINRDHLLLSSTSNLNEDDEDGKFCKDLVEKSLNVWEDYNNSLTQWEISKSSEFGSKIEEYFTTGTLDELIDFLRNEPWNFQFYREIPDVIVERFVKGSNAKVSEKVVDFFLDHKFYRQLACLMCYQSIPFEYFRFHSINARLKTFEYVFTINPTRISDLFEPVAGESHLFLLSSLVCCKTQFPGILSSILKSMIHSNEVDNHKLFDQLCLGLMIKDVVVDDDDDENSEYSKRLFFRNKKLLENLYPIIAKLNEPEVLVAFKACEIINMINYFTQNFKSDNNDHFIISSIYTDESEENVKKLFLFLFNVAARCDIDFFSNNLKKYQMNNEIDTYFKPAHVNK